MSKRYKYFSTEEGKRTAVPTGYSYGALCFGPIWALVNECLGIYVLRVLPGLVLALLGKVLFAPLAAVGIIYLLIFFWAISPQMAYEWREKALKSRGYKYRGSVTANSTISAIQKYEADEINT